MTMLKFHMRPKGQLITIEADGNRITMRCECDAGREGIWPCNHRLKLVAGKLRNFEATDADQSALPGVLRGSKIAALCAERERLGAQAERIRNATPEPRTGATLNPRWVELAHARDRLNRAIVAAMNGDG